LHLSIGMREPATQFFVFLVRAIQALTFIEYTGVDVSDYGLALLGRPDLLSKSSRRGVMDPINDIFRTMQIRAVVHARLETTAP
jgi:hypothetical protein